jgi:chemotaxis protein CheZ
MSQRLIDDAELLSWLRAMSRAAEERNEKALNAAVARFAAARGEAVTTQVRRVAIGLQFALDHFQTDSKLADLAQRQVPDARLRLAHVLRLTDDAAHRTMDLIERSCPLAERASAEATRLMALQSECVDGQQRGPQLSAFLTEMATSMGAVRSNLAEVLMVQGYQDLSGQIIRGVMKLIQELELALTELLRIAGPEKIETGKTAASAVDDLATSQGPVVPGIPQPTAVSDQQDVDALLLKLGVSA